jgi:hypothetical protein
MKDKADNPQGFIKMEEARRMMDQGQCQKSLVLALEALLHELDHLRSSLLALQRATRPQFSGASAPAREERLHLEPCWLPAVKPRVLH